MEYVEWFDPEGTIHSDTKGYDHEHRPTTTDLKAYLAPVIDRYGCDGTLSHTEEWCRRKRLGQWLLIRDWLMENGGYCDCEVIYNVPDGVGL